MFSQQGGSGLTEACVGAPGGADLDEGGIWADKSTDVGT
jgi:hypothetical protein